MRNPPLPFLFFFFPPPQDFTANDRRFSTLTKHNRRGKGNGKRGKVEMGGKFKCLGHIYNIINMCTVSKGKINNGKKKIIIVVYDTANQIGKRKRLYNTIKGEEETIVFFLVL